MKPLKCIVFVVTLVLLSGCTTTFRPWLLSDVQEGMDRAQVEAILGTPDSVTMQDGAEYLHYIYSEGYNPSLSSSSALAYDANAEFQVREIKESFKEHRYAVKLVDGKVLSYKEEQD
jgi:outer membrane protein assembly factor BamE (lipoprotein component of BamABCDE complex)